MSDLEETIKELVTVSYRLGAVGPSGSEYFADGRVYTETELAEQFRRVAHELEALLQGEGRA